MMRGSRARHRAGAILLEVMAGLAVLAMVGSTAAWMCSEAIRLVRAAREAELETRNASRLLSAVSLWPAEDLDRHLGSTPQGPWRLHVNRLRPDLYEVAVTDTVHGRVLLRTALFRPDTVAR